MFGKRWRLFRLLGIPVSLDLSWLIILSLLTWTLAQAFPRLLLLLYPETAPVISPAGLLLTWPAARPTPTCKTWPA